MLEELVALEAYRFMLVFCRVGAFFVSVVGFSSGYVIPRVRLSFALALSLVMMPIVGVALPKPPADLPTLTYLIFSEVVVGVFLGTVTQFAMAALDLAATRISFSTGFASAQAFNPLNNSSAALMSGFFSYLALALVFATDLDHLMLGGLTDSYSLFVPGDHLPVADFSNYLAKVLTRSFHIGFQLMAPFLVFSLILHTGMGLVTRLMPQLNVFFLGLPLQVYLGLSLLMISIGAIMAWFLKYFEDIIISFLEG